MTIVSLAENKNSIKKINPIKNKFKYKDKKFSTINALLNLISTTSKELQELNLELEYRVAKKTKELKYRYYHNHTTKLKNINALSERIHTKKIYAFALFEIDDFNSLNEIYGLNATNDIIIEFSKILHSLIKNEKKYSLYQVSNKQFAITLDDNLQDFKSFLRNIKYIQRNLKKHDIKILNQNESVKLDTTIGITTNYSHPIQTALIALNSAKQNRKPYSIFSMEMDYRSISKDILHWKKEIENAIKTDNIIPVFQPIVDKNQNINKYETLMRLRQIVDGKEKLISPFFFLDIAIKT
jgi:GGDEF domain-containing protein